jgi:hypothetical protein
MIKLTPSQWKKLKARLESDYKDTPSVVLMRSKCKEVLGFTVREHRGWKEKTNKEYQKEYAEYQERQQQQQLTSDVLLWPHGEPRRGVSVYEIHLDFYDDCKETWFRVKYL